MLTALLILLLVVIALLAIPLELDFRVGWPDGTQNRVELTWALGLVHHRIFATPAGQPSAATRAPRTGKQPGKRKSRQALAAIRQTAFRQRVFRFAGDLWRSIGKNNLRGHARIGLGDPADTGLLWAVIGPVSGVLANIKDAAISIEPDFLDPAFEFNGSGQVRFVPLQLIAISLGVLVSPAIWRGLRRMNAS